VAATTKLEPALAFLRELWALDHALGSTSKRMLDRMGITAQQRMVLRFIGKFPRATARELAEMLHVEKSTLSPALKRLEERGLVMRLRDAADSRKSHVVLTAAGRKFDRPTVGTVERAVERALQASSRREIDCVRTFFQRLVQLLEEGEANAFRRQTRQKT
jgi:DNA-binding MarR family transcriptional regulator